MKHPILNLIALSTVLLTAGLALGQSQSGAATPAPKPPKLVRVATLDSVKANQEFQANVQLLQAQRQAAIDLNAALEKEKDAKKKKELQTQLDALLAKLNENNATMQKTYGFSLNRNYTLEIERAYIYMQVSDEEAAKIEAAQKAKK